MGKYIQVPEDKDKAKQIVVEYGGEIIPPPRTAAHIPLGKALIVVVDNGRFEAAAFIYDEREFEEFNNPKDHRHHDYVLIDWDLACKLTGYTKGG